MLPNTLRALKGCAISICLLQHAIFCEHVTCKTCKLETGLIYDKGCLSSRILTWSIKWFLPAILYYDPKHSLLLVVLTADRPLARQVVFECCPGESVYCTVNQLLQSKNIHNALGSKLQWDLYLIIYITQIARKARRMQTYFGLVILAIFAGLLAAGLLDGRVMDENCPLVVCCTSCRDLKSISYANALFKQQNFQSEGILHK